MIRLAWGRNSFKKSRSQTPLLAEETVTLADIPQGNLAVLEGFSPDMPKERRGQLLAYGFQPGLILSVHQQNPVTVVQVEYTELAFEREIAKQIRVRKTKP